MILATDKYILIKKVYTDMVENSSLIVPDNLQKQQSDFKAIVINIGKNVTIDVREGDELIVDRNDGHPINKDNYGVVEYYSIHQDRCLAVVANV